MYPILMTTVDRRMARQDDTGKNYIFHTLNNMNYNRFCHFNLLNVFDDGSPPEYVERLKSIQEKYKFNLILRDTWSNKDNREKLNLNAKHFIDSVYTMLQNYDSKYFIIMEDDLIFNNSIFESFDQLLNLAPYYDCLTFYTPSMERDDLIEMTYVGDCSITITKPGKSNITFEPGQVTKISLNDFHVLKTRNDFVINTDFKTFLFRRLEPNKYPCNLFSILSRDVLKKLIELVETKKISYNGAADLKIQRVLIQHFRNDCYYFLYDLCQHNGKFSSITDMRDRTSKQVINFNINKLIHLIVE